MDNYLLKRIIDESFHSIFIKISLNLLYCSIPKSFKSERSNMSVLFLSKKGNFI